MAEKKETKSKITKEVEKEEIDKTTQTPANSTGSFVYIGKKGAMAYVLAVVTQFGMGSKEVIVKARGKSISRAVDVAEIVRNGEPTIKVDRIGIATEEVVTLEGRPLKISSIEIVLKK